MNGFLRSFKPIGIFIKKKVLKKYPVETFLIITSIIITIISLLIFVQAKTETDNSSHIKFERDGDYSNNTSKQKKKITTNNEIYVDISGAVIRPDLYKVSLGTRLKDLLIIAGGLSAGADRNFFARNYNLARFVQDQEKIYIPHRWEINYRIFTEPQRVLDYTKPVFLNSKIIPQTIKNDNRIDINHASMLELDSLPGIGKIGASKIIDNRPYSTVNQLLNKKIINRATYKKIKNLINVK